VKLLIMTAEIVTFLPGMPQEPAPALSIAALVATAQGLSGTLLESLKKAHSGQGVHGARRQIKQIRSLVRLMRPVLDEGSYERSSSGLRKAAQALAGQRRSDALQKLARKMSSARLLAVADRHRQAHAPENAGGPPQAARRAIAGIAREAAAWNLPANGGLLVAKEFLRTYAKGRKLLAKALESRRQDDLHEARKQVIHHLHHLGFLAPTLKKPPDERIGQLEALREVLGELNDLAELARLAEQESEPVSKKERNIVRRRRKKLSAKAQKLAMPLYRKKRKAFARRIGVMSPG
jgi:CHAD domain-containing protein